MFQWAVPFFPAQRLERQPTSCRRSILLQMVYRYQIGQQFVASGATSATSTARNLQELVRVLRGARG